MKTNPLAVKIFIGRRVAGMLAALAFAAALYALSWVACRQVVPCWPTQVMHHGGAAADAWFGR